MTLPATIKNLLREFEKLPGVGPKTSERLVFSLLKRPKSHIDDFIQALNNFKQEIKLCPLCYNFANNNQTEQNLCSICADYKRRQNLICAVADIQDLLAIEQTDDFNGVYHILGGLLNPLKNIKPEYLRIKELLDRINKLTAAQTNLPGSSLEIILALNPDSEGETTALYLTRVIKQNFPETQIKITRLARGLPQGSDLDYADALTLSSAIKGRVEIL